MNKVGTGRKIVLLFYVLFGTSLIMILGSNTFNYFKSLSAKQKSDELRTSIEKVADKKFETQVAILYKAGVIYRKISDSKFDICYISNSGGGWTVSNWYQYCYIRYVQGFYTNLDKNTVRHNILAIPNATSEFGRIETEQTADECSLFTSVKSLSHTVSYRPAGTPLKSYYCRVPNQLQGIGSVKGPFVLDEDLSKRAHRNFDSTQVDNSKDQIWIELDEQYYYESLGCAVGLLSCNNPRPWSLF